LIQEDAVDDTILVETIREAQAIIARHREGVHPSADDTIAQLMQLLDSAEVVKALADRGFPIDAFR
jgi:hypothetical protein